MYCVIPAVFIRNEENIIEYSKTKLLCFGTLLCFRLQVKIFAMLDPNPWTGISPSIGSNAAGILTLIRNDSLLPKRNCFVLQHWRLY